MAGLAFDRKISTHKRIGPGGMKCPCCGPKPGIERKQFFRNAKKRLRLWWRREISEQVNTQSEEG